jgi:hypothetical protein
MWYAPDVDAQITRSTIKAEKLPQLPGELQRMVGLQVNNRHIKKYILIVPLQELCQQ